MFQSRGGRVYEVRAGAEHKTVCNQVLSVVPNANKTLIQVMDCKQVSVKALHVSMTTQFVDAKMCHQTSMCLKKSAGMTPSS